MNLEMSRAQLKSLASLFDWARLADDGNPAPRDFFTQGHKHYDGELDSLSELVQYALQRPVYLNVYDVTRHYGGPEEGGWWYNAGELVETIETTEEKCDEVRAQLLEKHKDRNYGDIYSSLGGVLLEVQVDDVPGENWPTERPRYS